MHPGYIWLIVAICLLILEATKIFLPLEASGVLGAVAGVVEAFRQETTPTTTDSPKR